MVVLFGGPAGAGKTTLARAWCATRDRAAHIALDEIRGLIVSGLADPQIPTELQAKQFELSVAATCAVVRTFAEVGYDVAIDDVLEPEAFERIWRPELHAIDFKIVIVLPSLEETLARAGAREKRVHEEHIRNQHAASSRWSPERRIDTTGLTVEQSLALLNGHLA